MISHGNAIWICWRATIVALIVGTILNLINQGEAIFGAGAVNLGKIFLTYLVPFFVSAHGAFSSERQTTAPDALNRRTGE